MDSEINQSQPTKGPLPTDTVPSVASDNTAVNTVQSNGSYPDSIEPVSNGMNGVHLNSVSQTEQPVSVPTAPSTQSPVATLDLPVVPPTLDATTALPEPITTGGLIPPSLDTDPAQHEESDLRHSEPMATEPTVSEQVSAPVAEAPAISPIPAPTAAPIEALLDPVPESFTNPTEPPPVEASQPITYPNLDHSVATTDAMEIDEPTKPDLTESSSLPAQTIPTTSRADQSMTEEASNQQSSSGGLEQSVETAAPSTLPSQSKLSHPRDEEESFDIEPASKRVRPDDDDQTMADAATDRIASNTVVETPTAIEHPSLPLLSTSSRPQSSHNSRPTSQAGTTSRAGSHGQSKASSPVPASATASFAQKNADGKLTAPPDREHNPEWDQPLTTAQKKHLQRGIQNAKKGHHAAPFSMPVDPVALNIPTYFDIIKKPMDIKTIDNKLKNNDYSSVNDFLSDFDTMVGNSIRFNGPDHLVSQHGIHLRYAIDRNLSALPGQGFVEPGPSERKLKKLADTPAPKRRESRTAAVNAGSARSPTANQTFALKSDGVPLIRRDSTVQDGRPRREIHPPAPKDLPYGKPKRKKFATELKFCQKVHEDLSGHKYANINWPFLVPVDPVALNIPQYLKIIKKPMDLQTIGNKLKNGEYENSKEFEEDFRLMIANCLKFNPEDHPINAHAKEFEGYFDKEWKHKGSWVKAHAPRSVDQSPVSSDEDEEDEEEEQEDEEESEAFKDASQKAKLLADLQATMESVQAQIAQIAGGAVPKASSSDKKKSKSKSSSIKKEIKKQPSIPKPQKKVKKEKTKSKTISWEDKMSLSDRINDLGQKDMQQAMDIIKAGMPGLKKDNDDELELDIDELPAHVLFKLHTFVNNRSSKPAPKAPAATAAAHTVAAASSKPKKNRPMKKEEQEAKIRDLKDQLNRIDGPKFPEPSSADDSTAIDNEESSSDDDSEESEED